MILLPALLPAAAIGALLAGCSDPMACQWSSLSARALKQRLALLKWTLPGRARRLIAGVALTGFLASGGLLAYAAEPSAPQQLPKEVVGVIGSGDQLSLEVKAPGETAPRTIKVGQEYKDGWKLRALTPTSATLVSGTQTRQVGLNPSGILDNLIQDKLSSVVVIAGQDDAALIAQAIAGKHWDGQTPKPGLTLDETRRVVALQQRADLRFNAFADAIKAQAAADGRPAPSIGRRGLDDLALLDGDAAEYAGLMNKEVAANYQAAVDLYNRLGPVQVVAPGGDITQLFQNPTRGIYKRQPDGSWALAMPDVPLNAQLYPIPDASHPATFQPTVIYPLPGRTETTPAQIIAASPRS